MSSFANTETSSQRSGIVLRIVLDADMRESIKEMYRAAVVKHNAQADQMDEALCNSGFDLFMPHDHCATRDLPDVCCQFKIDHKIRCEMVVYSPETAGCRPRPTAFLLYSRSSASGCSLTNSVGVIDAGYRGRIQASFRTFNTFCQIHAGHRLVQICHPSLQNFRVELLESPDDFYYLNTPRGEGGFGSTGIVGVAVTAATAPTEPTSSSSSSL